MNLSASPSPPASTVAEHNYTSTPYERYIRQQRVSNWVDAHAYSDSFVLSPTLRDRSFCNEPDDPPPRHRRPGEGSMSSSWSSRSPSGSYVDHAHYDRTPPSRHRTQSHSRSASTPTDFLLTRDDSSNSRITDLLETIRQQRSQLIQSQQDFQRLHDQLTESEQRADRLGAQLTESQQNADQLGAELTEFLQNDHAQLTVSQRNDQRLRAQLAESQQHIKRLSTQLAEYQKTSQRLVAQLTEHQKRADQEKDHLIQILRAHEHKHQCEVLYAQGRAIDAAESLLKIVNTASDAVRTNKLIMDWIAEFTDRCKWKLETIGNEALHSKKHDEALAAYSTVLFLRPSTLNTVLVKWASTMLIRGSANEVLSAAIKFKLPRFIVYQAICDVLEGDDRVIEAATCFRQVQRELAGDTDTNDERAQWELDFRGRCVEKLEKLGDTAMDSRNHDKAIRYYSSALSLDPTNPSDILVKCCKARAGLLQDALNDATKAIEDDPSSYKGYKKKHAALHAVGRHREACEAFEMMLAKLKESPHPPIRELRHRYVDATPTIRHVVQQTIRHMPRVLIDTTTGRLYGKTQQAAAFEQLPIFYELRSSMTTQGDAARIRREVKKYYRYVMFSHRWENDEPLFQAVENISIHELEPSSPNIKLQTFCRLVRLLGFQWLWSDTCCIDRKDNVVLQESLVAMFTWYHSSSLTIVYLRGIWSQFQKSGALRRSIWNTRAWTYQEYVAAETVQFYTEDWQPYLGLDMSNHKESPAIISEMQQAAGDVTQELAVLRPGLQRIREKLYLASMRKTTLVEDIAYSLLGIFNVAIPVIYGEGNRAVGRFLEHILMGSGDVTILAWTGHPGSYNSCLPTNLTVYNQIVPPHVPQPMEMAEMDNIVTALHSSLPDLSLAVALHGCLDKLPSPSVAASRLQLPGIVFSITELDDTSESDSNSGFRVYRATTAMLGDVEIKTMDNLSGMKNLLLIHPWISSLLDQEFSHGATGLDDTTRALRLVARLRQPFGALLLAPLSRVQYRRVAADSLVMVRVREETSLEELIDGIRVVDVQ